MTMSNPGEMFTELFAKYRTDEELVPRLEAEIAKGFDLGTRFPDAPNEPETLLDLARGAKNEPAMLYLLRKDPTLVRNPNTALRSFSAYPAVIDHLLETGYKPQNASTSDWLDLQNMFFYVHPESLKLMAEKGLDLNVKINLYNGSPSWALLQFARYRSVDLLQAFFDAGVDMKVADDDGTTLLHVAVTGHKKQASGEMDTETKLPDFRAMVELALAGGLDIDTPDAAGQTALHHAAKRGYINKAVELVNRGARFDLKDARGRTPEKLAKSAKHLEVAAQLAALRAHRAVQQTLQRAAASSPASRQP
jgi:hypothetical protein